SGGRELLQPRGRAHGEMCRHDQHAWQRSVFMTETLQVLHLDYAEPLRHDRAGWDVAQRKRRRWLKSLVGCLKKILFAAQIAWQAGIELQAPENIPLARIVVGGVFVDDEVVIVVGMRGRMVLPAGDHNVKIHAFIAPRFLVLAQTLAQLPWSKPRRPMRACDLWRKQQIDAIVIDQEGFRGIARGSRQTCSCQHKDYRGGPRLRPGANVAHQHGLALWQLPGGRGK